MPGEGGYGDGKRKHESQNSSRRTSPFFEDSLKGSWRKTIILNHGTGIGKGCLQKENF